jgi:hypothetical protein
MTRDAFKDGHGFRPFPKPKDRRLELFASLDEHQRASVFINAALAMGRQWAAEGYHARDALEGEFLNAYGRLNPKGLPRDDD